MHARRDAPSTFPVGAVALCVLVAQMSGLTLAMHASRTQQRGLYIVSAAVLLTELLKLAACVAFATARSLYAASVLGTPHPTARAALRAAAALARSSGPIALPAVMFTLTQQLNLYAATELDAVTFQVTNQLKILPTAAFSVLALNRSLRLQQWLSLPLLALGVAVVNLSASAHTPPRADVAPPNGAGGDGSTDVAAAAYASQSHAHAHGVAAASWWGGLGAALAAAVCSGYASVYVERLLKTEERALSTWHEAGEDVEGALGGPNSANGGTNGIGAHARKVAAAACGDSPAHGEAAAVMMGGVSGDGGGSPGGVVAPLLAPPPPAAAPGRPLLTLNVQLAAWGACVSLLQLAAFNSDALLSNDLLSNFNAYTWAVIILQALGGLIVGVVLKYTDNIIKGFATAASILLSFVLESAMSGKMPTVSFAFGLCMVMASFALFSGPEDLLARLLGPRNHAAVAAAAGEAGAAMLACARAAGAAPRAHASVLAAAAAAAGGLGVMALYLHDSQIGAAANAMSGSPAAVLLLAQPPPLPPPPMPSGLRTGVISSEAGSGGIGGAVDSSSLAATSSSNSSEQSEEPSAGFSLSDYEQRRVGVMGTTSEDDDVAGGSTLVVPEPRDRFDDVAAVARGAARGAGGAAAVVVAAPPPPPPVPQRRRSTSSSDAVAVGDDGGTIGDGQPASSSSSDDVAAELTLTSDSAAALHSSSSGDAPAAGNADAWTSSDDGAAAEADGSGAQNSETSVESAALSDDGDYFWGGSQQATGGERVAWPQGRVARRRLLRRGVSGTDGGL